MQRFELEIYFECNVNVSSKLTYICQATVELQDACLFQIKFSQNKKIVYFPYRNEVRDLQIHTILRNAITVEK